MTNESKSGMEIEVKFEIEDPLNFIKNLENLNAVCIQSRVFERNLRYDTRDGRLRTSRQVLRLRQDTLAHMTFKGPALEAQAVAVRPEIEFVVSDFNAAREFLEALGYEISVIYEKYRTTFTLEGAEITLDEMPFGVFCEIEGKDSGQIEDLSTRLGFRWENRIADSYLMLFERIKTRCGLTMRDLTFDTFKGISVSPADYLSGV